MSDHLLPPNATAQERALSETIARVSDVPVPVREMYRADVISEDLLPWLAWAFSVDEWDTNWTADQKRAAVQSSVYVHQHKGTIGALRQALDALGYTIETQEWFQLTPQGDPYTFGLLVVIDGGGGVPTEEGWDYIERVALAAKNV